ncbi:MAG: histidine kinase dimerization/phosphoacceptor domain -containing protein [Rectinemataceae bacterium]
METEKAMGTGHDVPGYEVRLRTLLDALPDIVYALDEEGHFVFLNAAVRSIGYEPEELLGRHFVEILHPEDREKVSRREVLGRIRSGELAAPVPPKLFDERRSGDRMTRDLEVRLLPKGGGEMRYGSVNAYGESDPVPVVRPGSAFGGPVTMGVIRDVTADRKYRKSLEESLAAKELLLRELHHRVKNNLQVVASLAHLREMETDSPDGKAGLRAMQTQVEAMAMAHEAIYQTENLDGVRADEYFGRFGRYLEESYGLLGKPIRLRVEAVPAWIGVETLSSLALITNELVSNAYRHAFPGQRSGSILLRFAAAQGALGIQGAHSAQAAQGGQEGWVLEVSDDGIGLDAGTSRAKKGLGSDIVDALAKGIGASLERRSSAGSSVAVRIPADRASFRG